MTDQPQNAIQKVNTYFDNPIVKARFSQIIGSDRDAGAYIGSVLLAVANSPALQECTPASIYTSAMRAATLRLSVDPATKQAYLVPFKDHGIPVATLIVGYMGLYNMAVRTGNYKRIDVYPMFGGAHIEEDIITGKIAIVGGSQSKSDPITGWFSIFEFTARFGGGSHYIFMTVPEIHGHAQRYSKGYNNPKGGWKTDPAAMERKTVLRILLNKWGYLDPHDAAMLDEIESDERGEPMGDNDVEGEYTAQPAQRDTAEIMGDLGYN